MIVNKIRNAIIWLYSIPINYKVLPREQAKKLPLRVNYNTKCVGLYKGCIQIESDVLYKGMIQIGMKQSSFGLHSNEKSYLLFENNSKVIFHGPADYSNGVVIAAYNGATVEFGRGFYSNADMNICASKRITFGNDVMVGWNSSIRDNDGHDIVDSEGNVVNADREVVIGNNVWIGANVNILKGSKVSDGCVIGMGSLVTKKYDEECAILAGSPAKVVKHNIRWKKENNNGGLTGGR